MKLVPVLKAMVAGAVVAVGYNAIPRSIRVQLPSPRWLLPASSLKTVTLEQAIAEQQSKKGAISVTFLYLSALPPAVAIDLADDVKEWRQKGIALQAYSIDPVQQRGEIASYVKNIGLDVPPVWIQMPDGAACAFNQMKAVNYFSGQNLDPAVTIPLLTLVLSDRAGSVLGVYAVNVPNGGEVDPEMFNGALLPFKNKVTRALRSPAG